MTKIEGGDLVLGSDMNLQAVAIVLALATAQVSLVAAYDRDDDGAAARLVAAGTVLAIVVLAGLGIYDIAATDNNLSPSLYGIVSTLYLLGVALLILLHGSAWIRRRLHREPRLRRGVDGQA